MIVYEYEDNAVVAKTLTEEEKSSVVDDIKYKWSAWSQPILGLEQNRRSVAEKAKPKICKTNGKDDDWHSKIELNRPYEYYSKLYGLLYETFYDKISSYLKMGKERYDRVYNYAFNIDNKKSLLVCMKDMLEYGEIVASAELKSIYKKVALPIEEIVNVENPEDIVSIKETSFILRQKIGEKINFVRINPCNFAYDPLITPGTEDFDNCDKIVKQWKTKQEILTNKSYEITRAELDEIIGDNITPNERSSDKQDVDAIYRYNQIEVLTYYGNFYIGDKFYENYVAVVIGRSKLVYFKPKGLYTPGIYYYPYHALGNGARGVSPLFYILDLCDAEQKAFNDTIDFIELQKNPPKYVPVGFFEEEVIKIAPGKNITYEPGMKDPNAIIPFVFNAQPLAVFQETTKQLQKEIAGIDNGQLSVKSEALTEEEVKRIATSENLIPNMIISGIMLHIIAKYLKDCVQIFEGVEFDENIIKTAWEFANEQLQMQNVVGVLAKAGEYDPTMVKLEHSTRKTLETLGVNPDEYLNQSREQNILDTFAGLPDDILQQLAMQGQQLQIQKNNEEKARKMMAQTQDNEYRKALRESWQNTGTLPAEIIVPNGQGTMTVPVVPVDADSQVKNEPSTTAD